MGNSNFDYEQELAKCKTLEDVTGKDGLIQKMVKDVIQNLLENEMEEHLGRKKYEQTDEPDSNYRNGSSMKNLKTAYGKISLKVPRDRNAEFKPEVYRIGNKSGRI